MANIVIDSIKAEIVKIKASPFLALFEQIALKIAQQVEPANIEADIQQLGKIYLDLKPLEAPLRAALPQYGVLFDLLDQLAKSAQ